MRIALIYDFDHTLSPDDMQAQGWMQAHGFTPQRFWGMTSDFSRREQVESNLAYLYQMAQAGATRQEVEAFGSRLTFYPGVESWFGRVDAAGRARGIEVEHYVLSSGLEEMIAASRVGPHVKRIYASSFLYDALGKPVWVRRVVDYTNKTQFLFRISKGVLDPLDDAVNDFMQPGDYRIPFSQMVYLGDSATDIPCMKLVSTYGGLAIGVYQGGRQKMDELMAERRVGAVAPADYTPGSALEKLVLSFLDARVRENHQKTQ